MATSSSFVSLISTYFLIASTLQSTRAASPLLGVSPKDEMYYLRSAVIPCKDGSKHFSRDRLNDGYCDCVDGTDEPGTSACPDGRFYCRNVGNKSLFLFSSRVNDGICDCCDGSDEYDGRINCPNTCIRNGVEANNYTYNLRGTNSYSVILREEKIHRNFEDLIQKLKELKTLLMMEVVLLGCVIAFGFFRRRIRSRKRRYQ